MAPLSRTSTATLSVSVRRLPRRHLLVEDKDSLRAMLKLALEGHGHAVVEATNEAEAVALLRTTVPSLVLSDLRLGEGSCFGVLRAAKETDPELPVIVMTAYGSIQDAVAAMKDGALDFLAKRSTPDHISCARGPRSSPTPFTRRLSLLKEEAAARRGPTSRYAPTLRQALATIRAERLERHHRLVAG